MLKSFIKQVPTLFLVNRSMGVFPIILCMILSDFVSYPMGIYISVAVGALILLISYLNIKLEGATIMAYFSTFLLALFGISTFIPSITIPESMLSLYAEIGIVVFESILLSQRRHIKSLFQKTNKKQPNAEIVSNLNTRDTCTKLTRVLCIPHIIITILLLIFFSPLNPIVDTLLFHILPPTLLGIVLIGNQLFIFVLFYMSQKTAKISIVDETGKVIGKRFSFDVILDRNLHISPVIRIAVVCKDLIYLRQRSDSNFVDPQKTDIPLESYLRYGERLEDGVKRLTSREAIIKNDLGISPRFCLKYLFKNENTYRLIYLYVAYVEKEEQLALSRVERGKLWTIRQVETNIGKNFFGECFEQEFEQLKDCIKMNQIYK